LDNLSQKEKELLAIMAIGNESITIDEMKRITKSSNSFQLP
jgi:DNA-binding transcriptional regulator GbsR (MarR family)